MTKKIIKIVITGGPCAGKTTAMSRVRQALTDKGYTVRVVPETATELITGGVTPRTCGSLIEFQTRVLRLQLNKEKSHEQAAKTMNADKIVILCDRGALDGKAYLDDADFARICEAIQTDEAALRNRYDAVFYMVTSAKSNREYYTTDNNDARMETPEEAAALDDELIAAWTGHPHLRVIDNTSDVEMKIKRLITEITAFLEERSKLHRQKENS